MILIRYLLFSLIIYLIVRSFRTFGANGKGTGKMKESDNPPGAGGKKISKKVGEYVDYEELEK